MSFHHGWIISIILLFIGVTFIPYISAFDRTTSISTEPQVETTTFTTPPFPTSYPYSTPQPYHPYPTQATDGYTWSDASHGTQVLVVVLPIVVFTIVGMILLITTCCFTCRNNTTVELETPRSISCLSCWILICSILSFSIMMVSILIPRFSYMITDPYDYIWASFGPFSIIQSSPYVVWANIHWSAEVFSRTVGISMILAMVCLFITVWRINRKQMTKPFTIIVLLAAFLFTMAAIIMWIPMHIQMMDPKMRTPFVTQRDQGNTNFRSVTPHMGYSFILLIIAGIAQSLNVIFITIMRCASHPSHGLLSGESSLDQRTQQAQQDGLQLVDITSQYYYRDVPATPTPTPTPTYIPPTTPAYIPPVPAYVAPVYIPFEQSRPLSVGLPTAPITSSYPTLTHHVDHDLIPVTGGNTRYQRLL